jgi:hypothetical protein
VTRAFINICIATAALALQANNCNAIDFKGVNYAGWWPPDMYSSPASDQSLADAKTAGCTWVAINVFWFQNTIESNDINPDYTRYSATPATVAHAIERCHQLGMKVMLKPNVDVKDSNHWRGDIIPSDAWFAEYHTFINYWADLAEHYNVELLSIGCELVTTDPCAASWRSVANDVRTHYSGPLVYSSNWGSETVVQWWDAVDYIGIDAYWPLTSKNNPTLDELKTAWNSRANSIQSWRNANWPTKKVIFTEVGYGSFDGANQQPWAGGGSAPVDLQEQADCYQALITVCRSRDWWAGVFWWMWEINPNAGGPTDKGHTPQNKPAEDILSYYYITLTGDLDDDHNIDMFDLKLFSESWLFDSLVGWPDFNNDNIVDLADLALLAQNWRLP